MRSILVIFGLPALFLVSAVPLALRAVPPNDIYGIRLPSTRASLEVWYAANETVGFAVIIASLVAMAGSAALRAYVELRDRVMRDALVVFAQTMFLCVVIVLAAFIAT